MASNRPLVDINPSCFPLICPLDADIAISILLSTMECLSKAIFRTSGQQERKTEVIHIAEWVHTEKLTTKYDVNPEWKTGQISNLVYFYGTE